MPTASGCNRRTFLRLASLGGAALLLPASVRLEPWLHSAGDTTCPGARIALQVSRAAPRQVQVRLCALYEGTIYPAAPAASVRGGRVELETPYPFDDLVPGTYDIHGELLSLQGEVLERVRVGSYRVRPWRFSA